LTGQFGLDVVNGHSAGGARHLERGPAEAELLPQVPSRRVRRIRHIRMLGLPVGPQLRVLREEILDGLVKLCLECLELIDQLGHVVPGNEVRVGCREGLGILAQLMPGLLLDLLKDLAPLVRVDQFLRAERGDRLALYLVRRQVEVLRLVADAARPVRGSDDEQASELEQVDRLLAIAGSRVCLRCRRSEGSHGFSNQLGVNRLSKYETNGV